MSNLSYSEGFLKIWKTSPVTGSKELLVDQKNTILYQGSDILASALAGQPYSNITHMNLGFHNGSDASFYSSVPTISKDGTPAFSGYTTPFGYVKSPLSFPASFSGSSHYQGNVVVFTTQLVSPVSTGGATLGTNSYFYEAAMVAAGASSDRIFSRINFSPILYDNSYSFTISWAVNFTS